MKTQKPGVCGRQAGALAVCLAWPQVAANHHVDRCFSAAGLKPLSRIIACWPRFGNGVSRPRSLGPASRAAGIHVMGGHATLRTGPVA